MQNKPIPNCTDEQEEHFWSRVDVPYQPSGCWEWKGTRGTYGYFCANSHTYQAHRVAYTWLIGPIPDGLTIDHLCKNKLCVNPDHLEVVTQKENTIRSRRKKRFCLNGHPKDINRTKTRGCKECNKIHAKRTYWKKRGISIT